MQYPENTEIHGEKSRVRRVRRVAFGVRSSVSLSASLSGLATVVVSALGH